MSTNEEVRLEPRNPTERAVWNAAQVLETQGRDPTYEAVREYIGRGSLSTIGKYLSSYAERSRAVAKLPILPGAREDRIAQLAQDLVQQLVVGARAEVASAVQHFEDAFAAQKEAAEQEVHKAQEQVRLLTEQLTAVNSDLERSRSRAEELTGKAAAFESQLRQAAERNTELQTRLHQLEDALVSRDLERVELLRSIEQERGAMREAHSAEIMRLQTDHARVLDRQQALVQAAGKEAQECREQFASLESRAAQLQTDFMRQSTEMELARQALKTLRAELDDRDNDLQRQRTFNATLAEREASAVRALQQMTMERDQEREGARAALESVHRKEGEMAAKDALIERLERQIRESKAPAS